MSQPESLEFEGYRCRFALLRTPLLPFAAWFIDSPSREALRKQLASIVSMPEVKEALRIGAPGIAAEVPYWEEHNGTDRSNRIERTLIKYVTRMCGRPVPFGLFAGCSVVYPATKTDITVERQSTQRRIRLDSGVLEQLAMLCSQEGPGRPSRTIRYVLNSSAYVASGKLFLAQVRVERNDRAHCLVSFDLTPELATVIQSTKGAQTYRTIKGALAAALPDVEKEEIDEFLDLAIEAQILVPEWMPRTTGPEPLCTLASAVSAGTPSGADSAFLDSLKIELDTWSQSTLVASDRISNVEQNLSQRGIQVQPGQPFFEADLVRTAEPRAVSVRVLQTIRQSADLLRRICIPSAFPFLDNIKRYLTQRFEERAPSESIPLLDLLDEDGGALSSSTGPTASTEPLLRDLAFPPRADSSANTVGERDVHLLRLFERAVHGRHDEIVLTESDIAALASSQSPPLPDSFVVHAILGNDDSVFVDSVTGPSAARLMGRFCLTSKELDRLVHEHLEEEESCDPDAIFAEIVHLPEGRLGNIMVRPQLRPWEIPYLGAPSVDEMHTIQLSDLHVKFNGRVLTLHSERLGKRIVPRLTSAHNYRGGNSLPIYRFLCALQTDGYATHLFWDWGLIGKAERLPRVRYRDTILSLRKWRLKDGINWLARGDVLMSLIEELRHRMNLPRFVQYRSRDASYPVDLENVLSVETFASLVKMKSEVHLTELFPAPQEMIVRASDGQTFVHDLLVPFVSTRRQALPSSVSNVGAPGGIRQESDRTFIPGSEWIYLKLYGRVSTLETVLQEVALAIYQCREEGHCSDWFFVRYADPFRHVRVRLRASSSSSALVCLAQVLRVAEALKRRGLLYRVQVDTYEREVDRYGGDKAMSFAERIFASDSSAIVSMLPYFTGHEGSRLRWLSAALGAHDLLSAFDMSETSRVALLDTWRSQYAAEFSLDTSTARRLGMTYRRERDALETALFQRRLPRPEAVAFLDTRVAELRSIAEGVRSSIELGQVTRALPAILSSYVHMWYNRMFRDNPRAHELVLHDFVSRAYTTQLRRGD